jgi:hypothetical protein
MAEWGVWEKAGQPQLKRSYASQVSSSYSRKCDVLPIKRAIWDLVKFVFREENGREEAIYG